MSQARTGVRESANVVEEGFFPTNDDLFRRE